MKIKINWGTGIFIAIVMFMVFILSFVYKTIAIDKYRHHLISEDYYKDELYYQREIDNLNNSSKLSINIQLINSNKGIHIIFPEDKDYHKITGSITFLKLSNKKLDFKKNIDLDSHTIIIPDSILVPGKWYIKINWKYEGKEYLYKEPWFY